MRNKKIIQSMTLKEKASLLSGKGFWNTKSIDRLGVPSILLADGPHGIRKQGGKADHLGLNASLPATCFPTAATLANSWDVELLYKVGQLLGLEANSQNIQVLLGPGLNIKRSPLCGRNFEYFSEDPYLTGKMSASMIRGIQSTGVAACAKHYAVNSQEHLRMSIDEIVDERALRELYLEGFRYAIIEGKTKSIMTSYNKVNGEYANENKHLLKDILMNEWQYEGLVVTDWGGNNDRVKGLIAGNHLEMPSTGGITDKEVVEAVEKGTLSEAVLDQRIDELLCFINEVVKGTEETVIFDAEMHHAKAIEAAVRSIVLLKNDDHILPLDQSQSIGVIGDFAFLPRYQGAGSSLVKPMYLDNLVDVLQNKKLKIVGMEKGFKRFGGYHHGLEKAAETLAKECDIALVCLGLDELSEAEGVDRLNMHLNKNQLELIKSVSKINDNVVVIMSGGSPVEMPFADNVKAIVHGYLGGQGGAWAMADVLLGAYNPSGKLAESYPYEDGDVPSHKYYPGKEITAEHRESIYIGYRYYDKVEMGVRYPFGHGLSYTEFDYSHLEINEDRVSLKVENIGSVFGEEIVQLYIASDESKVFRASKELKGFKKVALEAGQIKTIVIDLDEHAFAYYNISEKQWLVEAGRYTIMLGASSRDMRLTQVIHIEGTIPSNPYENNSIGCYNRGEVSRAKSSDFQEILSYNLPKSKWDRRKSLDINDTLGQGRYKNLFGKGIYNLFYGAYLVLKFIGKPFSANNVYFLINMPFRQLSRFSQGRISQELTKLLLKGINFRLFRKKDR